MGQVVQVNGDYRIKTNEGGTIFLDTGPNLGKVSISGTVEIAGQTLTLSSDTLNIKDNILIINFGEQQAGVSQRYSGIEVDRGTQAAASFIFDEQEDTWMLVNGSAPKSFAGEIPRSFAGPTDYNASSSIKLRSIKTDSAADGGDLVLIGTGTGVVKVAGTSDYELQVTDDDDIPNKKYVDDAIIAGQALAANKISILDTLVIATDRDFPDSITQFETLTPYTTFGQSAASVIVDGLLTSQFYKDRVEIFGLEVRGFEISTRANVTNQNVVIRTQGGGKLQTNYAIQLDAVNQSVAPSSVSNASVLYGSEAGVGGTGIYVVSEDSEGELTNSSRALALSMIF